jgi:hypothetical protein
VIFPLHGAAFGGALGAPGRLVPPRQKLGRTGSDFAPGRVNRPGSARPRTSGRPGGGILRSVIVRSLAFSTVLAAVGSAAAGERPAFDFPAMIQPAPETAKFSDPDFYIWCGTMVRGDDGKCHLYYSRWPRTLGHAAWVTHSEVAHAVGDTPLGPFVHRDVALPPRGSNFWDGLCTHNPTVHRFGGRYVLVYTGNTGDGQAMTSLNWSHRNNQRIGVAVADRPEGPWQRLDRPALDVSADTNAPDSLCIANPSIAERPGGGYLLVYKAVGRQRPLPFGGPVVHLTATSSVPTGPFTKQLRPIFTAEGRDFPAEDPYVWYQADRGRYFAIVKDNQGAFTKAGKSLALFESADGFDWRLAENPLVSRIQIRWASGTTQPLHSLERPQLFFEDGQPAVLLCAVDETPAREFSYNVRIPLRAGLR